MNLLWRTKPASSSQHGQAEAMGLGVAVYAVAVIEGPTNMVQMDVKSDPLWEGIPCGEGCPAPKKFPQARR